MFGLIDRKALAKSVMHQEETLAACQVFGRELMHGRFSPKAL